MHIGEYKEKWILLVSYTLAVCSYPKEKSVWVRIKLISPN